MKWVTISKLSDMAGYTEKAIRRKIEEGVFVEGIHWKYAPDNRIHFNLECYEKWVEEKPQKASNRGKHLSALHSSGADSAVERH